MPLELDNVWVAGRCASMTHEAQSAARVTGACFVMGQAAGAAADLAQAAGCAAADVDIHSLQARLEAGGAYLGRQLVRPGDSHERTASHRRSCASSFTATWTR